MFGLIFFSLLILANNIYNIKANTISMWEEYNIKVKPVYN